MKRTRNHWHFSLLLAVATLAVANIPIARAQNFWEPCNGKEYLVNVLSLVANAKGTLFASTVAGDVLRSTNQGASWAPIMRELHKGVIALDSDDVLFAGAELSGIFRSTDEGDTWTNASSGLNGACSFAVDTHNVLYVGNDAGLWRSTDKGNHWSGGWAPGLPQIPMTIQTIGIGPGGILFVATVADDDVYRSTDDGTSWSRASTNLHGTFPNAFVFNSSGVLLAGTDGGIFRTADSGRHWVPADSGAWPARAFVFNAAGTLFAAAGIINYSGEGIIRSTDGGTTWSHAGTGMNNDGFAIAIDRNGTLYCGTSSGVFRSTDNGDSWSGGITGLIRPDLRVLAINEGGTIYAGGGLPDSLYRSTDNGNSWNTLSKLPGGACSSLLVIGDSTIYAGIGTGAAWSSDNGTTWTVMDTSLSKQGISSFCLATDGTLYAIADQIAGGFVSKYMGIIRSTDNGASWITLKQGLPKYPPSTLIITKSGTLLANVFNDNVYRSTDKGDSWVASSGTTTDYFSTMAQSPNGAIILGAMYASIDDGLTWTKTGFQDPGDEAFAINADGVIYAHSENDTTVFSTDNGQTWTKAGGGLGSSSSVTALAFAPNGQLFAATNGRVFRSAKSTLTNSGAVQIGRSEASVPTLVPNYPNPFSTSTTLTFSVPRTEFVSLRVYDLSGKCVGTIANGVFAQGSYQSSFPAGSLSNGIYLARLETEEGSWIQMLTLLR